MQPQVLKILDTKYITHDVKQFIVEKPKDLVYAPGQSAMLSINIPGLEDYKRPYTFTSLNDWPFLEFMIKIYEERNGLTRNLPSLNSGGSFLLHDVFGTIKYKGEGIFLAGGTGITPFVPIFRALYLSGNLRSNALIYSNHAPEDVILYEELKKMLGNNYINFFTKQGVIGFNERYIDRKFLIDNISDFDRQFYVCGPEGFVKSMTEYLSSLGAKTESITL